MIPWRTCEINLASGLFTSDDALAAEILLALWQDSRRTTVLRVIWAYFRNNLRFYLR